MHYIKPVLLTVFLLAMLALLAFGPRGTGGLPKEVQAGVDQGKITVVTYWEKWTGKEGEQMGEIVKDFNATVGKEKGIFIKYLSISEIDKKTLIATAAGVPPDIAGVWDTQVSQFSALNALEPLDDIAAEYGIKPGYYKGVYWKGCTYEGTLYALISTPATVALHYNKRLFNEVGLDPDKPPRTIRELDDYAAKLDVVQRDARGNITRIDRTGYLPLEPGWFIQHTGYWFGGSLYDEKSHQMTMTSPPMVAAFEWIRSYTERLGPKSVMDFKSGIGNNFDSPQNPFLTGTVAMVQQGTWMANYIEKLKPSMNRWNVPGTQAEQNAAREDLLRRLNERATQLAAVKVERAAAGTTDARRAELAAKEEELRREAWVLRKQFRDMCEWAAAPFPSVGKPESPYEPAIDTPTHAGFDVLTIPRGCKNKRQAFEFIAYVNRQEVMEKLCSLHCKNSPLTKVSEEFLLTHPNAYIEVFDKMAESKNAFGIPPIPIWTEVSDEVGILAANTYQMIGPPPREALAIAEKRLQRKVDRFFDRQAIRDREEAAAAAKGK